MKLEQIEESGGIYTDLNHEAHEKTQKKNIPWRVRFTGEVPYAKDIAQQISGCTKDHFASENDVCEISQTHKKGCEITSQQTADFATLRSGLSTCGIRLPLLRETSRGKHSTVQKGCEIILQQKGDFAALRKILPSAWSDQLAMAVTPSFQLQIVPRLKHWIVEFLSFETTYSMHKLDFRKCSKSG
uniref:Uncharacterized protein n=1 Tax=Vitis vinifera TaxID=29760 RepID=A5ALX8_VITVI|nr:hypothetical protein VITISV_009134 [Vitis vinifera]